MFNNESQQLSISVFAFSVVTALLIKSFTSATISTEKKSPRTLSVLNLQQTISKIRKYLVPPVSNKLVYAEGVKTMLVGGPNQRDDFHVEMGEELFFQIEGDMELNIVNPLTNCFESITIREGEMFLLPVGVPHSPQRFANTIGIVFERIRSPGEVDCLRWYLNDASATKVSNILYQECFFCSDLGTQLKEVINRFNSKRQAICMAGIEFQWPSDQESTDFQAFELAAMTKAQLMSPIRLEDVCTRLKRGSEYLYESEFSVLLLTGESVHQVSIPKSIQEIIFWQLSGSSIIALSPNQLRTIGAGEMALVQATGYVTVVGNGATMVIRNNHGG